jgi:hypothetical protein
MRRNMLFDLPKSLKKKIKKLPLIGSQSPSKQRAKDVRLLESSKFFDSKWYTQTYPEAKSSGWPAAEHYLRRGAAAGYDPSPKFSTQHYVDQYPDVAKSKSNPLLHYIKHGKKEGRTTASSETKAHVRYLIESRFENTDPLPIYHEPTIDRQLVMITDSIGPSSLFGGVATAMLFSAILAETLGLKLCIATRTEPPVRENFFKILSANDVRLTHEPKFHFANSSANERIPVGQNDVFVTTSWWTTYSTLRSAKAEQIIYLLQEDERMFYPLGDDYLRCAETLSNAHIQLVVNTKLLYDHLKDTGVKMKNNRALWFEPAFPRSIYFHENRSPGQKLQFLFYARPKNHRNLFVRGLEAIEAAIDKEILDPKLWDIVFIGKDLKPVSFANGIEPRLLQNLSWLDYAQIVRRTDLGLSLMYTPHPSYPPLDIASSGGVVVTNKFGNKLSLANYSKNIFCVDLHLDELVRGIEEGAKLAACKKVRLNNFASQSINRDWNSAFSSLVPILAKQLAS